MGSGSDGNRRSDHGGRVGESSDDGFRARLAVELDRRFDPDPDVLAAVLDRVEEARERYPSGGSRWSDPVELSGDIERRSAGNGLRAGWNVWIGVQRIDSSRLYVGDSSVRDR